MVLEARVPPSGLHRLTCVVEELWLTSMSASCQWGVGRGAAEGFPLGPAPFALVSLSHGRFYVRGGLGKSSLF